MLAVAETPKVSVVMPVHNAMPYLDIAVESILGQTLQNFEFVILDDASTDGSTERLREWASIDTRIRVIEEETNLGPALSSEKVARAARAPLVARMDADDVSHPDRLEEEVAIFARHPETGVVACLCDFIDSTNRRVRGSEGWRLTRRSPLVPFAHGAMMYRRDIFESAEGYRPECEYWEDQDLVTRMAMLAPVTVIPRALYQFRFSPTSTRTASDATALEQAVDLMYRSADRLGKNQGYDDLLGTACEAEKVDPRVFISLGSQLLWAGGRPRFFRRLLKRATLAPNFRTISAVAWTAWASLEPRSLRAFLRSLLLVRNLRAALAMHVDGPIRWPPASVRTAVPQPNLRTRPDSSGRSVSVHENAVPQPARKARAMAE
ncbi:MAG: glycosyltransferase family A protein [Pseudomonadota bacterium]